MNKIISKLTILSALLSLLLMIGCTPTVEPTADTVDEPAPAAQQEDPTEVPPTATPAPATQLGERIEVASAGFSVQPPANYLVDLDDPEGVQMHESEAAKEMGPGIAVFGGEFGDEISADEMYQFMIEADEMMQNVVRSPLDNPAADGFIAEFESEEAGVLMKGKIILTLIDGQGTIVTAGGPAEAWDGDFAEIVDAVAASIEMFPPVAE
ncbi:MAG: hypothetical protein AAGD96_12660 [Chloroflexota bacterium]